MTAVLRSVSQWRALALMPAMMICAMPAMPQTQNSNRMDEMTSESVTRGQRIYSCGHSFHMFIFAIVNELAAAAGIEDHQGVGRRGIGGSRVIQHWEVPEAENVAKTELMAGKLDVLTLAPIWLPDEGIDRFAELGFKHNPDIRITVQEFWLPNDTYEPVYPLDTRKPVDHNATKLDELRQCQARYDRDLEDYVSGVNRRLGKQVIFIVPVGRAALALREKVVAGEAPGLSAQADLFRDSWGHPEAPLQALNAYCHFAVIYRRSPVGLPAPSPDNFVKVKNPDLDPRLNRLLQELAWDAVSHHPLSGVKQNARSK